MNRISIPIEKIAIVNRQRQDYGDLNDLSKSLERYGLIQPIVLNQENRLIAGGRRLAAATQLGWSAIDCVYRETLSDDELHELELEENVRRKEMSWQERALNIQTIHRLKKKRAALDGTSWGQRETAELLGIKGASNVNYALRVADAIEKNDQEIKDCSSLSDALKVLLRREEAGILAELARRNEAGLKSNPQAVDALLQGFDGVDPLPIAPGESSALISDSSAKDAARAQYLSNPLNDPNTFEEYWIEKQKLRSDLEQHRMRIPLSYMLRCGDSVDLMNQPEFAEHFDAIITDIPYGIDMDMLNQGNDGHAFKDIETVVNEHTVDGNESLFRRFFPAAYACLKPNSFLITWCDAWQYRYMADLAIAAGFKVQRWPFVWIKSYPCMNQSANTNFTKTFEIALVCRKGTATLMRPNIPSHVVAGMDDLKSELGGHPFIKPFAVWEPLISAVSYEGCNILEPFAGMGSGVISLLRMKRRVVACELNVEHYNALAENVRKYYTDISPNYIFV